MNFDTSFLNLNITDLGNGDKQWRGGHVEQSSYEIENFLKVISDVAGGDPFKVLLDPTYTGFKIFFHFQSSTGLLASENNTNSALAYLQRIGQNDRFQLLKRFITVLSMINSITPWMFQEITGLDELWSKKRNEFLLEDKEIEIKTLETLDGKMQSIINMYREICWDDQRKVYILPINLRRFSMSIYVYDFRMFGSGSTTATEFLQTIKNTDIKRLNHHLFDLGHCEFTEDSGKDYFSSISNNPTETAGSNLSIRYQSSVTSAMFRSITGNKELTASTFALVKAGSVNTADLDQLLGENNTQQWVDRFPLTAPTVQSVDVKDLSLSSKIDNSIKEAIKATPSYLADQASKEAAKFASSQLSGLFMGNVYGLSTLNKLTNIEQITDIRTAYEQISQIDDGNPRIASLHTKQYSNNLGNINR